VDKFVYSLNFCW